MKRYLHVAYLIANKKGSAQRNKLKIKERKGVFDSLVSEKAREYLIHMMERDIVYPG